jgi:hypothetical protein
MSSSNLKIDIHIEAPFIKIVQDSIINGITSCLINLIIVFKGHKKFIEKELNNIVRRIDQVKKTGS